MSIASFSHSLTLIEPELLKKHEERNREAWRSIVDSDDWVIPPPIEDEEQFRREVSDIERILAKQKAGRRDD